MAKGSANAFLCHLLGKEKWQKSLLLSPVLCLVGLSIPYPKIRSGNLVTINTTSHLHVCFSDELSAIALCFALFLKIFTVELYILFSSNPLAHSAFWQNYSYFIITILHFCIALYCILLL